jgi:hypothetical protein
MRQKIFYFLLKPCTACIDVVCVTLVWFCLPYRVFLKNRNNFLSLPDPDPHPASCSNFVLSYHKNIFNTVLALRERYRYRLRYLLLFFLVRKFYSDIFTVLFTIRYWLLPVLVPVSSETGTGTDTWCCFEFVNRLYYSILVARGTGTGTGTWCCFEFCTKNVLIKIWYRYRRLVLFLNC